MGMVRLEGKCDCTSYLLPEHDLFLSTTLIADNTSSAGVQVPRHQNPSVGHPDEDPSCDRVPPLPPRRSCGGRSPFASAQLRLNHL